jgi:hypothetical protein
MRASPLLLPALLLAACIDGGVKLDDTGPMDGDADTDSDADTDTDTDADTDIPGDRWVGTVTVVVQSMGVPFCDGSVQLGLEGGSLEGVGECEVSGGPGAGSSFGLDFQGQVDGSDITGTVTPSMEGAPQDPPPVDFSGTMSATEMTLDFSLEMPSPDDPQELELMVGEVMAAPAD